MHMRTHTTQELTLQELTRDTRGPDLGTDK